MSALQGHSNNYHIAIASDNCFDRYYQLSDYRLPALLSSTNPNTYMHLCGQYIAPERQIIIDQ